MTDNSTPDASTASPEAAAPMVFDILRRYKLTDQQIGLGLCRWMMEELKAVGISLEDLIANIQAAAKEGDPASIEWVKRFGFDPNPPDPWRPPAAA